MKSLTLLLLTFILLLTGVANLAAELPVEAFFGDFQYKELGLSPDGNYLGVTIPRTNGTGLAIVDLKENRFNWMPTNKSPYVLDFIWATTNRLIYWSGSDLFAVDRNGSNLVQLATSEWSRSQGFHSTARFLALMPGSDKEILVTSLSRQPDYTTLLLYSDVYRMNFFNGKTNLDTTNPGHLSRWIIDHNGVPRIGMVRDGTRLKILHRAGPGAKWDLLADYNYDEHGIVPLAFLADNRTLLVSWYGDQDTKAIYTFDVETKKIIDVGFRHAQVDIDDFYTSPRKRALVGVTYHTERPEVFWLDPDYKRWQEAVDSLLTNTFNKLVNISRDESKAIFLASNDRTPGAYYLLDTARLQLKKIAELAEWIHPEEMSEMKPIEYKSRDGLTIHGYVTFPQGASRTNLPLVVIPHSEMTSRFLWGYASQAQFFANRGYAVLRVNARGSHGYGRAFLKAGFREWGLKQQDDITDGVKWTIEQGIADPRRICIFGEDFGGFSALCGLEQNPELYRCGICYAGFLDMADALKRSTINLKLEQAAMAEAMGDPKKDKDRFKLVPPLANVGKIQVPVFLAYSENDAVVPIDTVRDFAKDLKKRGKLYDLMIKRNEFARTFVQKKNEMEFWTKVDEFLKANMQ